MSEANANEVSVCDVSSAVTRLFEAAQPLKNYPVSEIQLVSKKHYQSLLGDREKAYKIGLAFTRSQEELLCELETTQKDLDQTSTELRELQAELTSERKRGKRDLAVSVGALLKEQDEARKSSESLKMIIADLNRELGWHQLHQKKHRQDDDSPDPPISSDHGDMIVSKKRQRISDSPTKFQQLRSSQQLISSSQTTPRTLYIKFTKYHPGIDELMSEIIPGRVESVYWNTPSPGHRFAFVNFISRLDARQFLDYTNHNPNHLPPGLTIEWGLKLKPMTPEVVEAIIDDGATRILRVNDVSLDSQHSDIWSMAGKTTFRFVRVVRKRENSVDIALEFNSVEDALHARGKLSDVEQLRECLFAWGNNVTDHLLESFVETRSGDGRVIRIRDVRVPRTEFVREV